MSLRTTTSLKMKLLGAEWKFVLVVDLDLYVVLTGMIMMPQLPAINLDFLHMVGMNIKIKCRY